METTTIRKIENAFGKHFYLTIKSPQPTYNVHISASLSHGLLHNTDTEIQRHTVLLYFHSLYLVHVIWNQITATYYRSNIKRRA